MKKALLCLVLLMATCLSTKAQYQKGDLFLYPRIGFALANVSQQELYYTIGNGSQKSKMKHGLAAGIEAEAFVSNTFSISAGLFYTNQGFRFPDWAEEDKTERTFSHFDDIHTTMHYVSLPVLLNGYLADGLAVKAGVQLGYLVKASEKYDETWGNIEEGNAHIDMGSSSVNEDITANFNRLDFSIPVGISYEYSNIVIDLRYNIGFTKVFKNIPIENGRNQVLMVTLGYQLEL